MKYFIYLITTACIFSCNQNNGLIINHTYFDSEKTKLKSEGTIDKNTERKEGYWKFYNLKGELVKAGTYKNSQQTGAWEYFRPLRQKGELINGKKEGIWKSFHNDGSISVIANYINDLQEGKCESFYQNGKLSTESYYKNGKLNGPYIIFSQRNGDTSLYATYVDDQRNGLFKNYTNGMPYVIGHWKPDIGFVGEVRHYRNEKLIEIEYKDNNGKTISKKSLY